LYPEKIGVYATIPNILKYSLPFYQKEKEGIGKEEKISSMTRRQ